MKRHARRWRSITAVVTVVVGAATFLLFGPGLEWRTMSLVPVEIPPHWMVLPVTARLRAHVEKRDVDWDGHGFRHHTAALGRFEVSWSEQLYKGMNAGFHECTVSGSGVRRSYSLPPWSSLACPNELREDTSTGIHVLAVDGHPMGAFRIDVGAVPDLSRLIITAVAMGLTLMVMATLRAWRDDRA